MDGGGIRNKALLLVGGVAVAAVAWALLYFSPAADSTTASSQEEPSKESAKSSPATAASASAPAKVDSRPDISRQSAAAPQPVTQPPPRDPVGVKRCMQDFLSPKGPHSNDPHELERAGQGALKHSGFRALQDVYLRIGLVSDFIEAVNRSYKGSVCSEGDSSPFLRPLSIIVTILANQANNESVLPLFVSSGLIGTCVGVLRDDLGKPHDHRLVEQDPKRHTTKLGPWDALVEAVMRLLLNISVNDAGAFLLLEERAKALRQQQQQQEQGDGTGVGVGVGVDALGPLMQMARLNPPLHSALASGAAGHPTGDDITSKPLRDPFADPFNRKLWAWKVMGNLSGIKEGRAFLRAHADELFFGAPPTTSTAGAGAGAGQQHHHHQEHNLSIADVATLHAIGSAEADAEVRDKAREVAAYLHERGNS